jgi:hypothetical protein
MVTQFSVTLLILQTKSMLKNKLGLKNPKVFNDLDSFQNNLRLKSACIRSIILIIFGYHGKKTL